MHYEKLFEKGTIGRLELRNRVVMTAMGTMLGDWNGCSTPEQVRFYEERAKGGCGLIIPEFTSVDPDSATASSSASGTRARSRVLSASVMPCTVTVPRSLSSCTTADVKPPRQSTAAVRPWRRA